MTRKLLLFVGILLFQGCGKTESYRLVVNLPTTQVDDSKEVTKTLRVYSINPSGADATCEKLISGVSAPESEGFPVEVSEVISDPFSNKSVYLRTQNKNDANTRLFFVQGENSDSKPILRGCSTVAAGNASGQEVTVDLTVYCDTGTINCNNSLSDGCETDSTAKENCGSCNNSCVLGCETDHCTVQFTQIVAGFYHTCALTTTGTAYCWGSDDYGQLGNGDTITGDQQKPVAVAGGYSFKQLTAGYYHTCGILASDGTAYCWGTDAHGQLGNGDLEGSKTAPFPVSGGHFFEQITAGGSPSSGGHTCGLQSNGDAYCWGENESGQLGNADTSESQIPVQVQAQFQVSGTVFTHLETGETHSCGLDSNNDAWCWGDNFDAQLGNGSGVGSSSIPVAVVGGKKFIQLSAGGYNGCGLLVSDGTAWCWGANEDGQIGNGVNDNNDINTPTAVLGGLFFKQISAGGSPPGSHTCGLRSSDGTAYCWGFNSNGELGNGTNQSPKKTPFAVSGGLSFEQISAGGIHTCALTSTGAAYCWGNNAAGQLGNGTGSNSNSPYLVNTSGL